MKHLKEIIFFILLLSTALSYAQNGSQNLKNKKIETYKSVIKQKWNSNIDSAIFLANRAIVYCDSIQNVPEKITFIKMKGLGYYYSGQFSKADSIFHLGLSMSQKNNYKKLIGDYYNLLMITKRRKNVYDSAVYYGNKNIAIRKETKDSINLAGAYDNLANVYIDLGDYKKAIELNTQSIDIFKQSNNLKDLGIAYVNLSNLYGQINDSRRSLIYLQNAVDIFMQTNDVYGLANSDYDLGIYYFDKKNYNLALDYFQKSYQIYKKFKKTDALGDVNFAIGEIYLNQYKYNKAYKHLKKAEALFEKAGVPDYKAEAESKLALLFLKQKIKDSALKYLKKAELLSHSQSLLFKKKLLQIEMDYHKTFGNCTIAYEKSLELNKINDSIHTLNLQDAINKKLLQFKLNKMKSENIQLKQKRTIDKLNNKQMKITALSMSGISVLLFVTLYLFLKKRKKEKEISGLKLQKSELEKQEIKNNLKSNERQLTGFTLHMMQKNLILKDLLDYIKKAEKAKNINTAAKIREFKIKLINAINSDQDWETFEIYFEKVNPNFIKNLKQKHPNLTSKEIKLSIMIRLNMDIKETASTLNVEPNSVRMARYRLRKKLGLSSNDNLHEYMLGV